MVVTNISDAGILAYANAVALVIPLFIIAILVDSSRDASRIGPNQPDHPHDRTSIGQSRRTLLAIIIGVVVEFDCLNAILTTPNDDSTEVFPINYVFVAVSAGGLLALLLILFIPHVELHVSAIRKEPSTVRWTLIMGWLVDVAILASALIARFIGESLVNHTIGYGFFVLFLLFTGSMVTLTVSVMRRRPNVSTESELAIEEN